MTGKAIVYDILYVMSTRLISNDFGGSINIRQCNGFDILLTVPQSLCRADQSQLKIKIPETHTVH